MLSKQLVTLPEYSLSSTESLQVLLYILPYTFCLPHAEDRVNAQCFPQSVSILFPEIKSPIECSAIMAGQ